MIIGNINAIGRKGGISLPPPDALFNTRSSLTITDSIGAEEISLKDFIYFNHQGSTAAASTSGINPYHAPDTGDLTYILFIRPTQEATDNYDIRGIADNGNNYMRVRPATKTMAAYLNGGFLGVLTFPDSANFTSNLYMLVYKYNAISQDLTIRIYNTSSNYVEDVNASKVLPSSGNYGLKFSQTATSADCGLVSSLYYTSDLNDTELTSLYDGTIKTVNLTSFINFTHDEALRTYCYDSKADEQFQVQSAVGDPVETPYYNRATDVHVAHPLIYGYTYRDLQQISYNPDSTKGITAKVGDVEHLTSGCLWNMCKGRAYFNGITDTTIKAIFDKSNTTYWKTSIQSEDDYIDSGGGYYGVWNARQLQRDFIEIHAQIGHENHIFSSLRTMGAVVTGITAIRVYKENLT